MRNVWLENNYAENVGFFCSHIYEENILYVCSKICLDILSSQYQMILGIDNIKKLNLGYQPNNHTVLYKNEPIPVAQIEN